MVRVIQDERKAGQPTLVLYDVQHDKRRTKVMNACKDYGLARWHSSHTRQTHTIPMDIRLRNRTLKAISEVRAFIGLERCPPPTSQTVKCLECELRNFCGDTL